MAAAWEAEKDIYALVKDISFNGTQEFTDDIWGRWAWIVSHHIKDIAPY